MLRELTTDEMEFVSGGQWVDAPTYNDNAWDNAHEAGSAAFVDTQQAVDGTLVEEAVGAAVGHDVERAIKKRAAAGSRVGPYGAIVGALVSAELFDEAAGAVAYLSAFSESLLKSFQEDPIGTYNDVAEGIMDTNDG